MAEYRLCSVDQLPQPGKISVFTLDALHPPGLQLYMANMAEGKRRFVAFNVDGKLHVANDMCPHQAASLAGGTLNGSVVTCPWHFWQFDLGDGGRCLLADWAKLKLYKTRIEGSDVFVTLEDV
ncbi:MAG: Rieske 2Fe-2S domain-containing protein [Planctomycetaceae bacterium]|nr:Rieske 2Fe-2S domain-containing protein [Planctomycetaceae bacterium]